MNYSVGGYTVVRLETQSYIECLTGLFNTIAIEQCWEVGDQLRAYTADSCYWALLDYRDNIVGGLQIVMPNETMLPVLTVWPELGLIGRMDVCDFALTAIAESHRRLNLFWMLHVEGWRYCRSQGVNEIYVEITNRVLKAYNRLGMPFKIVGEQRKHWGELCYPCMVTIDELLVSLTERKKTNPELYLPIYTQALR